MNRTEAPVSEKAESAYPTVISEPQHVEHYDDQHELHAEGDRPAVMWPSGTKEWYRHGVRHRDNNRPAEVWSTGTNIYWVNGIKHRTDGPAIEWADGSYEYFVNGLRHRADGPAVHNITTQQDEWWENGALLRQKPSLPSDN